ncbi:MAG TPA: hypothetical protein VFB03_00375 [Candidatus Saccharimonadales bacterium]|nr:hypothetical protein [Candidatus Saccharimonadales bacterium]
MIALIHVSIALLSLVVTGFAYISPAKNKIYASYSLIAATLISGTVLAIVSHSHLLSVCTSGLLYLGIVGCGVFAAHRKMVAEASKTKNDL